SFNRFLRCAGVIAAVALVASCANEGVRPANPAAVARLESVPKSMARVVLYREQQFVGSMVSPTVMVNGRDLVNAGNRNVFVGAFRPGHYVFESNDKNSGTEVN